MTATKTKERPILFKSEMIRAILANLKTQTRRLVNPPLPTPEKFPGSSFGLWHAPHCPADIWDMTGSVGVARDAGFPVKCRCPYGEVGDRLWCRETFCLPDPNDRRIICYRASGDPVTNGEKWKPSIFLPRWACRLELEITEVRVQRLQDISEEDAIAEGMDGRYAKFINEKMVRVCKGQCPRTPVEQYAALWDRINKDPAKAWAANPWCWCVSFRRI